MPVKDLDYYQSLDYDICVIRIEDGDEFAYKAYSKDLDPLNFYGVGDTKKDAIESFEHVKQQLFEHYYKNDIPILEPTREETDLPSGKFLVRTSPSLHAKLVRLAAKSNQSLNQYVNGLFTAVCSIEVLLERADNKMDRMLSDCEFHIKQMYQMSGSYTNVQSLVSLDKRYDTESFKAAG